MIHLSQLSYSSPTVKTGEQSKLILNQKRRKQKVAPVNNFLNQPILIIRPVLCSCKPAFGCIWTNAHTVQNLGTLLRHERLEQDARYAQKFAYVVDDAIDAGEVVFVFPGGGAVEVVLCL